MRYQSIFQPLTEKEQMEWQNKTYQEPEERYDSRAVVMNEEEGVQLQQTAPQQPQQVHQPQQVQSPQQPQVHQPQVLQPNNILNDQTWKAYQQNPTYETLKAFYDKLTQVMQKLNTQFGQNNQIQQTVPQQPQQVQQSQPQVQTPQTQQTQMPVKESKKDSYFMRVAKKLNENEEKDSKDSSTGNSNIEGLKDGNKYDSAYNKDEGGKEHDFGWDKMMHDSIFGTKEDPFTDTKDVKYSEGYGNPVTKTTERDNGIEPTKADPFKPEKPSFTSLSNPNEMGKTIFTKGTVQVKDAPAIPKTEKVAGPEVKKGDINSKPKTDEDDGSDDIDEGFYTNYDSYLKESYIEDSLKKVIIQEFLNEFGGVFDLGQFNDWIIDNYPQIANDPNAFDEVSSDIESRVQSGDGVDEDFDDDTENEDSIDDITLEDEEGEEMSLEEVVEEYMEQFEGDEYDEEDAESWLDDNYEVDDETKETFLDAVSDMFIEDDINESINDEFFANEPTLNE